MHLSVASGPSGGDAESVAVWVHEVAFASGEPVFVDRNPELSRDRVDILDVQVNQGVGTGVACVF